MKLLTRIFALVFAVAGSAALHAQTGPAFSDFSKPRHAMVNIQALSTATHNGYSGSQDVYFADIQIKKGEHIFAKLMDIYEGYGYPIRRSLLTSRATFKMDVVRQTDCDQRGAELFLPPSAQIYDGGVPEILRTHHDEVVPCFRTVHKTIKPVKKK